MTNFAPTLSTEPDAPLYQHAKGASGLHGDFSSCTLAREKEGNYTREVEKNPCLGQFNPTPGGRESHVKVFDGEMACRIRPTPSFPSGDATTLNGVVALPLESTYDYRIDTFRNALD